MSTLNEMNFSPKLWIIFRLFGLVQYPQSVGSKLKQNLLQFSHLPINILYFVCLYVALFKGGLDYTVVSHKFRAGIIVITSLLQIGKLCWYRRNRMQLKELLRRSKSLEKNYEFSQVKLDKKNLIITSILCMFCIDIAIMAFTPITLKEICRWVIDSIPRYFIYVDLMYLFLFLKYFREKFYLINYELKRITNSDNDSFLSTQYLKFKKIENIISYFRTIEQCEKLSFFHYDVLTLANKTSDLFSFPFIYNYQIFLFNIISIIQLFSIVGQALALNTDIMDIWPRLMLALADLLFYFWSFFVAIKMWNRTENEANKAATYVHKIWNTDSLYPTPYRTCLHLQLISARFLSTKTEFSANNYVRLNWIFFLEIMESFLMYASLVLQLKT